MVDGDARTGVRRQVAIDHGTLVFLSYTTLPATMVLNTSRPLDENTRVDSTSFTGCCDGLSSETIARSAALPVSREPTRLSSPRALAPPTVAASSTSCAGIKRFESGRFRA